MLKQTIKHIFVVDESNRWCTTFGLTFVTHQVFTSVTRTWTWKECLFTIFAFVFLNNGLLLPSQCAMQIIQYDSSMSCSLSLKEDNEQNCLLRSPSALNSNSTVISFSFLLESDPTSTCRDPVRCRMIDAIVFRMCARRRWEKCQDVTSPELSEILAIEKTTTTTLDQHEDNLPNVKGLLTGSNN